jgi:hypothetical protein
VVTAGFASALLTLTAGAGPAPLTARTSAQATIRETLCAHILVAAFCFIIAFLTFLWILLTL